MVKKNYFRPLIKSEELQETSALSCGKTPDPPPGSHHFASAYETFTGHFAHGFGTYESLSGTAGGMGVPGCTSNSYSFAGICLNWITYTS